MDKDHLVEFLRMVADEVERNASFEGRIFWTYPDPDDPEQADLDPSTFMVDAFVRNGNDLGQGGCWLIGQPEPVQNATTVDP